MSYHALLGVHPVASVSQVKVQSFAHEMPLLHRDVDPDRVAETIATLFTMSSGGGMDSQHTVIEIYSIAMSLTPLTAEIASQEEAKERVIATLRTRGSDYGNTVLDVMGTWYTATNAAAKALRMFDHYQRFEEILLDELLDIAGYCVLSMAILDSMQEH